MASRLARGAKNALMQALYNCINRAVGRLDRFERRHPRVTWALLLTLLAVGAIGEAYLHSDAVQVIALQGLST